ncbi:5-oxoprolinase/urea amidolyase family protein [Georgenia thermotolerans]|uniref:5-oxoprolinase/urea amidolyase family protein n=1 Tax=Georgenia thermotolerans TaxID=527326 RepID=A0A7J5US85_9MICO|nr:5-oxoprolinase/urea amidolyase family protein [Georgenia thermotolerans]KAE8764693.1 5-oxoprolinase/urea amidolyase family protein [Georgenia thermotolerans]
MTGPPRRQVRPVGDRAVLAECDDLQEVIDLHATLQRRPLPGQRDVLAAARTVMVVAEAPSAVASLAREVAALTAEPGDAREGPLVEIDTVYDGEDLAVVAELTGLSPEGVVRAHTGQVWTAAFGGFAPGFAYLVGENHDLDVPRRDTPRTAVPAGSVALAGGFSAVYPRESPGGWQLIGRTGARMWDLARPQPALVRPGARVRYRAVREVVEAVDPAEPASGSATGQARPSLTPEMTSRDGVDVSPPGRGGALVVEAPGLQSLVEDLGRPGYLDLGVCPSGAVDRGAAVRANRLVGNPRDAAVVETVPSGLRLRADGDQVLAVTGAPAALTVEGDGGVRRPPTDAPFALRDGEVLALGPPRAGLRSYVAVRGGLDLAPVLGSRATDTMSGLGPAPLEAGAVLPVRPPRPGAVVAAPDPAPAWADGPVTVAVVPGPREGWFAADALASLCRQDWAVTDRSNRVGLRLDGEPLARTRTEELPSEGTVAGAVQVPASGLPVVFLADHPTSGGYPVIAVVRTADLDRLAQVRPGDSLRFVLAPSS